MCPHFNVAWYQIIWIYFKPGNVWPRQMETLFILESMWSYLNVNYKKTNSLSWFYQYCCFKQFFNNSKTETLSNVLLFYRKTTSIMQQVLFHTFIITRCKRKINTPSHVCFFPHFLMHVLNESMCVHQRTKSILCFSGSK